MGDHSWNLEELPDLPDKNKDTQELASRAVAVDIILGGKSKGRPLRIIVIYAPANGETETFWKAASDLCKVLRGRGSLPEI